MQTAQCPRFQLSTPALLAILVVYVIKISIGSNAGVDSARAVLGLRGSIAGYF